MNKKETEGAITGNRTVPTGRERYTMAELLAASDYSQPQPVDEREWVDAPAVGGEWPNDEK